MDYTEKRNELLKLFGTTMGLGRNISDCYYEGFYNLLCGSDCLMKVDFLVEFNVINEINDFTKEHFQLFMADDLKKVISIREDLFNPDYVYEDGVLPRLRPCTEEDIERFKNVALGIQSKYYPYGLNENKDESKANHSRKFHNEVMVKEVDEIIKSINSAVLKGHGHVVLPIVFKEYGEYMEKRLTEEGFTIKMSNDKTAMWVVINPEEEKNYLEKRTVVNPNFA